MTQFIDKTKTETKGSRKTVFKKFVGSDYLIRESSYTPEDFPIVEYIGYDPYYGDVFKAIRGNRFTIYFGYKGDEFND